MRHLLFTILLTIVGINYTFADEWDNLAADIPEDAIFNITVEAKDNNSGIYLAIGEENLEKVQMLTVSGTINGYDFMILRNKMLNLKMLDITNVEIVANDYEYYDNYKSKEKVLGANFMEGHKGLKAIKLPKTVVTIGGDAFRDCHALEYVLLPPLLEEIGSAAFRVSALDSITFPPTLKNIGTDAFGWCSNLTQLRIPASVEKIGPSAFDHTGIEDIYTYTVEPVNMANSTFSKDIYLNATIHTPSQSHDNYYWDTQWSQFQTQVDFDEPYEYFYINNDYTLDDQTNGRFEGDPDADLNEGSGLIIEGSSDQGLGEVHAKDDGDGKGASIIGDGNIDADKVVLDIKVRGGKWHFFCFPFDIRLKDIVAPSDNWVFRHYDGATRAQNGSGGWQNLADGEEWLRAGQGYIFQCNKEGTLSITVQKEKYGKFEKRDEQRPMETHTASDKQNASWNFLGNPYLSYYDLDDLYDHGGYDAPITRWTGSGYEAIRPGDDEYYLHPFEAFFVQKPEGQGTIDFKGDDRITYQRSQKRAEDKRAGSRAYSRKVNAERMLINLELTDGTSTDKTRVVFNDKKTLDYEIGCDAAKFLSSGAPQLYTLDRKQVKYAINERPVEDGSVQLGYSVAKAGQYEISATRMDCPMLLLDQQLGTTFDLSLGSYTFTAEAGSNSNRFLLLKNNDLTGVSDLMGKTGVSVLPVSGGVSISGAEGQGVSIYTVGGVRVADSLGDGFASLQGGAYIVKVGNNSAKVIVK